VLDAQGRIVRHLAAGLLATNAAAAAEGLKQEMNWNGNDDRGGGRIRQEPLLRPVSIGCRLLPPGRVRARRKARPVTSVLGLSLGGRRVLRPERTLVAAWCTARHARVQASGDRKDDQAVPAGTSADKLTA